MRHFFFIRGGEYIPFSLLPRSHCLSLNILLFFHESLLSLLKPILSVSIFKSKDNFVFHRNNKQAWISKQSKIFTKNMIKEGKTNLPSWLLMAAMVTQRRHSQCWTEFGVNDVYGGRGRFYSCYRNRCRTEESADERRSVVGGGATLMESKQRQIQKNIGRYQLNSERFTVVLWFCFRFHSIFTAFVSFFSFFLLWCCGLLFNSDEVLFMNNLLVKI